jgi:8-oxo-dGTP pyrophosphatase MutT (NUDIX family)
MKESKRRQKKGKYRRGIFAVTYAKDKGKIYYLILKRKHHWSGWEFTKGGIDSGESKERAARREVKEETGLVPLEIKKFNYSGKYLYKKKFADRTGMIGQTFSLYAVRVKNGKVKIDKKEHTGYKWFDFDTAVKKVKHNNQKRSLRIVNDFLMKKNN